MRVRERYLAGALLGSAGALSAACTSYPQRLPGPLILREDAPPAAEEAPSGALTIFVQRDSDPVWVLRPGERGSYPVPFYEKRERLPLGSEVRTGSGGRAEVSWSPGRTSLLLFDEGRVELLDPQRDEPLIRFHSVTHALIALAPGDEVELVGGARLRGDPRLLSDAVLLELVAADILRVTNQSKLALHLRMREEPLDLGPGESLDLPLLASGGAPRQIEGEPERFDALGVPVACWGSLERLPGEPGEIGLTLQARAEARVEALGIVARLAAGESLRITDFAPAPAVQPAAPEPEP